MLKDYKSIIKNNNFHFDNYKIACKELGETLKGGESKVSQLNDWNRYFFSQGRERHSCGCNS